VECKGTSGAELFCSSIEEKQEDEHGATSTYGQLGLLAGEQRHFIDSGQCLIKATVGFRRAADLHSACQAVQNFLLTYWKAPAADQVQLEALWNEAGLGPFPKPSA
jgi:hypothetical protein